ncbi:MAG TPA: hypothetical protein PKA06_14855, partial [Gemmatales bacterium]|nr:hypothetical protein [Gemmatales bacterium]
MSGIFLILLGLSLTTFPGINIDWKQGPQWQLGQEYLYRGTVRNTGQSEDIQLLEQYSLEVRLLVTQVRGRTGELVCATKLVQTNSTSREVMPSTHLTFFHA